MYKLLVVIAKCHFLIITKICATIILTLNMEKKGYNKFESELILSHKS